MREIIIERNDGDQRLDRFLRKYLPKAPLSYIYRLIRKDIRVNGRKAKEDSMLQQGDTLQIFAADMDLEQFTEKKRLHTAKRQFRVLFENDDLIIVSKPFGLLVHGDKTEKKDTLANQVTDYLIETGAYVPRLEKSFVPSPVHRLDRNTTGLVIFGKNAESLRVLSAMLRTAPENADDGIRCAVRKFYYTIVSGRVDAPLHLKNKLIKDVFRNTGRVVPLDAPEGKYIETVVRPVYTDGRHSLIEIELVTGRSHQIRAHLSSAGHPLLGDTKYGGKAFFLDGDDSRLTTQLLHAARVEFAEAPAPLDYLNGSAVSCPLPETWQSVQQRIFGRQILQVQRSGR